MDHPNVTIATSVVRNATADLHQIEAVTDVLRQVLGDDHFRAARVEWDLAPPPEPGERQWYRLTISMPEWGVTASKDLPPYALRVPHFLSAFIRRLWGDILRRYNHALLKHLQAAPG